MSKVNDLHIELEMPSGIPCEERLEDHDNKIEEYLDNCTFRGEAPFLLRDYFKSYTCPFPQNQLYMAELAATSIGRRWRVVC
jgi:hypothetical protein